MTEAEAIVNRRPLTTDDLADPDSLDVLTPNHLLTMKGSVILLPPGNFQKVGVYSNLTANKGLYFSFNLITEVIFKQHTKKLPRP